MFPQRRSVVVVSNSLNPLSCVMRLFLLFGWLLSSFWGSLGEVQSTFWSKLPFCHTAKIHTSLSLWLLPWNFAFLCLTREGVKLDFWLCYQLLSVHWSAGWRYFLNHSYIQSIWVPITSSLTPLNEVLDTREECFSAFMFPYYAWFCLFVLL